jgi:hypothetical protein
VLSAMIWSGVSAPSILVRTEYSSTVTDFFKKYSINIDTYIHINIYSYERMYVHPTLMSTSKRLSQFDFEIYEVGQQERLAVYRDVVSY